MFLLFDESVLPMKVLDLVRNYLVTSLEMQNNHLLELFRDQLNVPITKTKNNIFIFYKKMLLVRFEHGTFALSRTASELTLN